MATLGLTNFGSLSAPIQPLSDFDNILGEKNSGTKGAGLIGYTPGAGYGAGSVGLALDGAASSAALTAYEAAVASSANGSGVDLVGGSGRVISTITALRALLKTGVGKAFVLGYYAAGDGGGGQYYYDSTDTTSSDNGGTIIVASDGGRWKLVYQGQLSVKQFGAKGDGSNDDTTSMQAALTWSQTSGGRVLVPQTTSFYLISNTLNVGVSGATGTTVYTGVELVGLGLPTIKSNNTAVPVLNVGGVETRVEGLSLQYTAKPANTLTNAVAIRAYNLAYSYIGRIYAFNVYGLMDMYQGGVAGTGANFAFSNTYTDLLCQQYSGWGIKMLPFVGGNSGSIWRNIYLNSNNNTGASGSGATFGGFWLQTCQNEVVELLNIEWQRNSGSAIVLNQCHNAVFKGIHFEGLYPTTPSSPLIDILAGDGSCPTFESITMTGCDWTGLGGSNQGALFRLDNLGARVVAQAVNSYSNTTPANMSAVFNAGATCYGSTVEFITVNDIDGSLSSDAYTPKVAFGTITTGVEYPLQRWNLNIAKHSSLAVDNAGGTNSTVAAIPGSVTSPAYDGMGLWDSVNKQFVVKQAGAYQVQVLIPAGTSPVFQVKQNGTTVAGLTPPAAGGHDSLTYPFARGDAIKITLASGSYTRTGVSFGISLAS